MTLETMCGLALKTIAEQEAIIEALKLSLNAITRAKTQDEVNALATAALEVGP